MKSYNRVYHAGPLVAQVLLDGQVGFAVRVLPTVTVAVCAQYLHFGLSFEWLFGTVNVGVMNAEFTQSEKKRLALEQEMAEKRGLTVNQFRLQRYSL